MAISASTTRSLRKHLKQGDIAKACSLYYKRYQQRKLPPNWSDEISKDGAITRNAKLQFAEEVADICLKSSDVTGACEVFSGLGFFDEACDHLDALDRKGTLPIAEVESVLRDEKIARSISDHYGKIVICRALKHEGRAIQVIRDCLNTPPTTITSTRASTVRLDSKPCWLMLATMVSFSPQGKDLMKALHEEDPKIAEHLIQHREERIREQFLRLLLQVASDEPPPKTLVSSDLLDRGLHVEDKEERRDLILQIAQLTNPVRLLVRKKGDETVCLDTMYLVNWGREKGYFRSNVIRKIIDEMAAEIKGSQALEVAQNMVKRARFLDLLLFLIPKRYRGHEIHQFNVAAFGLFLLDIHVDAHQTLADYIRVRCGLADSEEVKKAWIIASLLHDHALPINYMFKVIPSLRKRAKVRKEYETTLRLLEEVLKDAYIDLFSETLLKKYKAIVDDQEPLENLSIVISAELRKLGFKADQVKEMIFNDRGVIDNDRVLNHGILAAVNVSCHLAEEFRKKRVRTRSYDSVIRVAVEAIAVHDLKKPSLSLRKEPFVFLLVLCDELQEWGREIVELPEILVDTSSIEVGTFRHSGKKMFFNKKLFVHFNLPPVGESRTKFSGEIFENNKKDFKNRMDFDDPAINPYGKMDIRHHRQG
jgi:hypothetical protein